MASILKVDQIQTPSGAAPTAVDLGITPSSGEVVNTTHHENSTRVLYSSTQYIPWFNGVTVSKKYDAATSYLLVTALCMEKSEWSYANNWFVSVGNIDVHGVGGWTDTAQGGTNSNNFTRGVSVFARVNGVAAGDHTVSIHMHNNTGSNFARVVVNPNTSDDGRYKQQVSTLIVQEIKY